MTRTIAIGIQNYNELIENDCFYVDKTSFIKEWWESMDSVTLITRPRRFGKTLNMSMTEQFFSLDYAGRSDLFEGKKIWEDEKFRELQGTYPVISLSFANVKEKTYERAKVRICRMLTELYDKNRFLLESSALSEMDKRFFEEVHADMDEEVASFSLHKISEIFYKYYGKKVIILLDEYDTPMQEAYVNGYWEELVAFTRSLFNSTFKTNPWLERAIMTGITRVSYESIFSDLNHSEVVTTTSEPERFYHGFVLGLLVELQGRYSVTSNRESGFGRYDVVLEPILSEEDAIILEFKVFNPRRETDFDATLENALVQIEQKKYAEALITKGIPKERIRSYGFAFEGKNVLIG